MRISGIQNSSRNKLMTKATIFHSKKKITSLLYKWLQEGEGEEAPYV